MATETKLIRNRAPETREILSRISGRALNWTISILGLLFLLALFAGSQVQFDTKSRVIADQRSDGSYEITSNFDGPVDKDFLAVIGEDSVSFQPKRLENSVLLIPRQPLPSQSPGSISLVYEEQVHLLQAVFKGLW